MERGSEKAGAYLKGILAEGSTGFPTRRMLAMPMLL